MSWKTVTCYENEIELIEIMKGWEVLPYNFQFSC